MKAFTTADLNKQIGAVTDAALKEPVFITHHRRPRFVLMTVDSFEALSAPKTDTRTVFTLEDMPDDLRDGLLALADQYAGDDERR
jgi:PHD/YefM family antitoxin component YafN of YafNO toxin-antitoxin module